MLDSFGPVAKGHWLAAKQLKEGRLKQHTQPYLNLFARLVLLMHLWEHELPADAASSATCGQRPPPWKASRRMSGIFSAAGNGP